MSIKIGCAGGRKGENLPRAFPSWCPDHPGDVKSRLINPRSCLVKYKKSTSLSFHIKIISDQFIEKRGNIKIIKELVHATETMLTHIVEPPGVFFANQCRKKSMVTRQFIKKKITSRDFGCLRSDRITTAKTTTMGFAESSAKTY